MLLRLLLIFIVVPLLELWLLLYLADVTSWKWTLLLVVLTGIAGTLLARSQGWKTWSKIQLALREGRMPEKEIQEALLIFLAGAVLLTPGLLTDTLGLLLLIPPTREVIRRWLIAWLKRKFNLQVFSPGQPQSPRQEGNTDVLDSYVVEPKSDSRDKLEK